MATTKKERALQIKAKKNHEYQHKHKEKNRRYVRRSGFKTFNREFATPTDIRFEQGLLNEKRKEIEHGAQK